MTINNLEAYYTNTARFTEKSNIVAKSGYKYCLVDIPTEEAVKVNDGETQTICNIKNRQVMFDLGVSRTISGFDYLPDQSECVKGVISSYELYACDEYGKNQILLSRGEFANIKNNPIWQKITFKPVQSRYLLLKAIRSINDDSGVSIAECIIY